jgi:predicted MPP superfamily phosphohydrolase
MMWEIFSSTVTILFLFGLLIIGYAHFIEPHTLEVTYHKKEHAQKSNAQLRIVQISDIHLGDLVSLKHFDQLIDHVNRLDADVILLTGDLLDAAHRYKYLHQVPAYLNKMKAKYGKFAVYGNHEYNGGGETAYSQMISEGDFELLVNQVVVLKHPQLLINIGGADCATYGQRRPEFSHRFDPLAYNILMLHQGDAVDPYKAYPIDVVFSGHTHAGQIRFPFVGALILPEMGKRYVKGWYTLNTPRGMQLYINRGFGMTMLPFRLLSRPEVTVVDVVAG